MIEIRISEEKMQKDNDIQGAKKTHRQMQASTTLNRRYVKKPTKSVATTPTIKKSPMVKRFTSQSVQSDFTAKPVQRNAAVSSTPPVQKHPLQQSANAKMRKRSGSLSQAQQPRMTAKQIKDQAIKKALATASAPTTASQVIAKESETIKTHKHHFGIGRVVLALACAAAAIFAIVYFVNLNMPDISLKVAAMQTGIEASYPGYVPRDYALSGIVSAEGKITLSFTNGASSDVFSITEESSSWDSNALLNNYVKDKYGDNYTTVREQGLTIYISGSSAAWANGGIVYKLEANPGSLTKKQISSIATSL